MSELLKELMVDFGLLSEYEDVEKQVKAQLDRATKMDEVDTVTFGLETDDGRMVKVYVKAEQANDFEKALAGKLGAVDSIEQALNELSKDFEIVAVDWPEEAETGDEKDEDEEGEETADQTAEKPEGEDVLNQQVYYNRRERDAQGEAPMSEPKESYKDKVRAKLLSERDEAVGYKFGRGATHVGGLDAYFSYPLQFQIYKAILELGVPDVALTKSAYRQQIIQGIRRHAAEVMSDGALRNRLAYFLNQEIHQDIEAEKRKAAMRESLLTEDALGDFEALLSDLLTLLDNTPDNKYAKIVMNSSQMKALLRGASGTALSAQATMRSKMAQFQASLTQALQMRDAETKKAAMAAKTTPGRAVAAGMATESLVESKLDADVARKIKDPSKLAKYVFDNAGSYEEGRKLFNDLHEHPDFDVDGMFRGLLNAMTEYVAMWRKKTGNRVQAKHLAKRTVEEVEADGKKFKDSEELAKYALRKHGGNKQKAKRFLDLVDAKEKVDEATAPVAWEITKEGDNVVIACDAMTVNVDEENTEKLVKALSNKTAVVVRDAESGNKYTFSPRGSSVRVKQTGSTDHCVMSSKDVNDLLSVIAKAEKKEKAETVEEAKRHHRKKVEQPAEDEPTDEVDDESGDEADEADDEAPKVKVKVKKDKNDDDDEEVEECDTGKKKRMSFKEMKK